MKTTLRISMIITLLFIFNSCDWFNFAKNDERIILNNNSSELGLRIEIKDEQIPMNGVGNVTLNKSSDEDSSSFVLVLRAEVAAPVYEGKTLRASHICIENDYAYVSYNREGEEYLGGIEVFDISDIHHPTLVSQAILTDTDVSSLSYKDGALYLAEAQNPYINDHLKSPAILEKMILNNGLLSDNTMQIDLDSYVTTDVDVSTDMVYACSGSNGFIYCLDPIDLSIDTIISASGDHQAIAIKDDKLVELSCGTSSSIVSRDLNTFQRLWEMNYTPAIPESKGAVAIDGNYAYVALNEHGLKVIDLSSGIVVDEIDRPETPAGTDDIDYVTNGVSINDELVLIANGASGVWVGKKVDDYPIEIYGSMDFNSSTNFVEGKDDVIFVASGFGGLKILEVQRYMPEEGDYLTLGDWDENGLPSYLEAEKDSIDDSLLQDIHKALPWIKSAPDHSPEFFNNVETNLIIDQDASLYITYIYESAGFKNSLGYYTFDPFNPPTSVDDIDDMTIIFPNTSQTGSGGSLEAGHTVYLGDFETGTGVGFFLVSNGWKDGEVTQGLYSHYTHFNLNPEMDASIRQHTVLLKDDERDILIMGFEDVSRKYASCDQDFDDTVFLIRSTPKNAYVTNNIPDMEINRDNYKVDYKEKNSVYDMTIAEGWRPFIETGYTQDNDVYVSGSSSAKIVVNSEASAARLTINPTDFSNKVIRIRFRVEDWDVLSRFDLRFYTNEELTDAYIFNFRNYFASPNDGEWYNIVLPRSAFEAIGNSPDWSTVREIIIRTTSTENTEVYIDEIELYRTRLSEGLVTVSFDDGFDETYTEGALYMEQYGLSGTAFVMPDEIGTPGFLTENQVDSLDELGWGISGHLNINLRYLDLNEVETKISQVSSWLKTRDYTGKNHFAYPNGSYNTRIQDIVLRYFSTARTIDGFNQPLEHIVSGNVNSRTIGYRNSTELLKAQIDDAIANNEWLILNFHKLVETAIDDIEYNISDFQEIIDYLYESGVTVLPYHEVIEQYGIDR